MLVEGRGGRVKGSESTDMVRVQYVSWPPGYCSLGLWLHPYCNMGGYSYVGFILKIVYVKRVLLANLKYSLLTIGLTDGGTAGLIWGFVIVCIGFLLVFASLAEMASM